MWEVFGVSVFGRVIDYIADDILYEAEKAINISKFAQKAIEILDTVPSISPCHDRDFKWARPIFVLKDGTVVKTCKNIIGLNHIFLADNYGHLIYGGFVNWNHSGDLKNAINQIKRELR
ncbi:hypothetical protein [Trichormus sp. NMC-1]|uniref:hypothetical protein n=1 Tax=Trichormus sp. NMC-1 TaxID=1853259 RepID=UPI0008DC237F|nr:hypothetical protein [Trichormus sp. NMC-1]